MRFILVVLLLLFHVNSTAFTGDAIESIHYILDKEHIYPDTPKRLESPELFNHILNMFGGGVPVLSPDDKRDLRGFSEDFNRIYYDKKFRKLFINEIVRLANNNIKRMSTIKLEKNYYIPTNKLPNNISFESMLGGYYNYITSINKDISPDLYNYKMAHDEIINIILGFIDPHSGYSSSVNDNLTSINSSYGGVGIGYTKHVKGIKIIKIVDDSPAEDSPLRPGDIIIGKLLEDGSMKDYSKISTDEISDDISGLINSKITFVVHHGGDETKQEIVTIVRGVINNQTTLKYDLLLTDNNLNILYLRIPSFYYGEDNSNVCTDFDDIMEDYNGYIDGVIFDLRDNLGGLLFESICIADLLIDEGVELLTLSNRDGGDKIFSGPKKYNIDNMVVIVNSGTASSAEILTSLIRDNTNSIVIGERSFGKATIQNAFSIGGKNYRITSSEYYFPGYSIQGQGIAPDIGVVSSENIREEDYDNYYKSKVENKKLDHSSIINIDDYKNIKLLEKFTRYNNLIHNIYHKNSGYITPEVYDKNNKTIQNLHKEIESINSTIDSFKFSNVIDYDGSILIDLALYGFDRVSNCYLKTN